MLLEFIEITNHAIIIIILFDTFLFINFNSSYNRIQSNRIKMSFPALSPTKQIKDVGKGAWKVHGY